MKKERILPLFLFLILSSVSFGQDFDHFEIKNELFKEYLQELDASDFVLKDSLLLFRQENQQFKRIKPKVIENEFEFTYNPKSTYLMPILTFNLKSDSSALVVIRLFSIYKKKKSFKKPSSQITKSLSDDENFILKFDLKFDCELKRWVICEN